jgi:hypothetical protein
MIILTPCLLTDFHIFSVYLIAGTQVVIKLGIYKGLEGIFVKEPSVMSPRASRSQEESVGQTPGRVGPRDGRPAPLSGVLHSKFVEMLPWHREGIFYVGNGGSMQYQVSQPRGRPVGHPLLTLDTPFSQ